MFGRPLHKPPPPNISKTKREKKEEEIPPSPAQESFLNHNMYQLVLKIYGMSAHLKIRAVGLVVNS